MSSPQLKAEIRHGDCVALMRELPDNSVDSIVTDPPYGLGFMGKEWDDLPPSKDWAAEALRVLKPGGHLLAFGGTRTYHRLAVAIEDAGFEIRDSMIWLYGSGFPKSLDVSKAIDNAAGVERADRITTQYGGNAIFSATKAPINKGTPITSGAKQWHGWGTALKPAHEPIVVARKPLIGTVAENVLEWGIGAMNIDGCRIDMGAEYDPTKVQRQQNSGGAIDGAFGAASLIGKEIPTYNSKGRWPANVVLSHTIFCGDTCADGCPVAELDRQSGISKSTPSPGHNRSGNVVGDQRTAKAAGIYGDGAWIEGSPHNDSGGASRFFYVAKANKRERPNVDGVAHPTVKPLALMRWLVRLVTPAGGTVLEPFAGSGTTVEAALLEGCSVLAFEKTADYLPLIHERIRRTKEKVNV